MSDAREHADRVADEFLGRRKGKGFASHAVGERTWIGKMIREGIVPPTYLEPDILLEGAVHWVFGDSESGKTWLALWAVVRRIKARQMVLYLDKENGAEIVGERLEALGCDPEAIDEYLYYMWEPELRLEEDRVRAYEALLAEVKPVLVVYDASRGFLTVAGLEENVNDDLDKFYEAFLKPVRARGAVALVIDHTPHEGKHARGASRKRDLADVMWRVKRVLPFDETRVGEVRLYREKGRRGALPDVVPFSIGGGSEAGGFVMERSAGTFEQPDASDGLTASQRRALDGLRGLMPEGATFTEWWRASGIEAKQTFVDALNRLVALGLAEKRGNGKGARYFIAPKDDEPPDEDVGTVGTPVPKPYQPYQRWSRFWR